MRIVAGEHRSRRIKAPDGARPTADRVREAVFSILGDVSGVRVLDLFAGSGALGLEALSRGAAQAVFVDSDPAAVAVIEENLGTLGLDAQVHRTDAIAFLRQSAGETTYGLVLADPPYDSAPRFGGPLADLLPAVLEQDAMIVTESNKRLPLLLPFPVVRERTYGNTRIAVHRGH
jgi:16S rRNA (guanine966-N2)-methyltransferase